MRSVRTSALAVIASALIATFGVAAIGTASAARLTKSGDEGISTKAVLMHFETPSTDAQQS